MSESELRELSQAIKARVIEEALRDHREKHNGGNYNV